MTRLSTAALKQLCAAFWFQEKERLRREKNNERHLSKMRRLELRRQELELAKQLKKPNEDMCLADHKVRTRCRPALLFSGSDSVGHHSSELNDTNAQDAA